MSVKGAKVGLCWERKLAITYTNLWATNNRHSMFHRMFEWKSMWRYGGSCKLWELRCRVSHAIPYCYWRQLEWNHEGQLLLRDNLFLLTRVLIIYILFFNYFFTIVELWPSSSLSTGRVVPLRGDWAIFCHAGSGRVGRVWSVREKSLEIFRIWHLTLCNRPPKPEACCSGRH